MLDLKGALWDFFFFLSRVLVWWGSLMEEKLEKVLLIVEKKVRERFIRGRLENRIIVFFFSSFEVMYTRTFSNVWCIMKQKKGRKRKFFVNFKVQSLTLAKNRSFYFFFLLYLLLVNFSNKCTISSFGVHNVKV